MYDPLVGRFLEEDPLGFAAGDPNLHRYVGNSPTNATDPSGMQPPDSKPTLQALKSERATLLRLLDITLTKRKSETDKEANNKLGRIANRLRDDIDEVDKTIAKDHPIDMPKRQKSSIDRDVRDFYCVPDDDDEVDGRKGVLAYTKHDVYFTYLDLTKDEYVYYRKGCIGLNQLRLGLEGKKGPKGTPLLQATMPGVRVFDNLDDALRVQAGQIRAQQKNPKNDKTSIVFAVQSKSPYSAFDKYRVPNTLSEYEPELLLSPELHHDAFDFMTAIQNEKGEIKIWESMPAGANANPDLIVKHWATLPTHNYSTTFYCVVEVKQHRLNPPILP